MCYTIRMIGSFRPSKGLRKSVGLLSILSLLSLFSQVSFVHATSITDLQQQQQQLQQQAAQAAAQAAAQGDLAKRAANSLQQVSGQISSLNGAMQDTSHQVQDVQSQITQKDQQIASLESNLRTVADQQNALIRQLYIMTESQPDSLALFSNQSVSARAQNEIALKTLEDAATATYAKTKTEEEQVVSARDQLKSKNDSLASLQSQQQTQQQVLADAQTTQQALKSNAVVAEQQLEAQAAAAQAQAAVIAKKILVLSATANWGNQIVSGGGNGWYYSQIGDGTLLGRGPDTVNDVGCLITSIAMVATYYGHQVTPDYIATHGTFSNGYLVSLPSGIGVYPQGSQKVNWGVVNNEIANHRPVIVSIYLPSVGAINSDGSSHFVVIYGFADGKYLMNDPISPSGRSYNLNQVRSMVLVSPS